MGDPEKPGRLGNITVGPSHCLIGQQFPRLFNCGEYVAELKQRLQLVGSDVCSALPGRFKERLHR